MVYQWFVLLLKSCVYLNYSFPIKVSCYDPWYGLLSGWLPAVLCLQAFPLPSSVESHELLLLHILTAKASCSTANPHCPLIRKLEMEENKQKIKDKKQKQSNLNININKKGKIRRGFYGTSCRLAGADAPSVTYFTLCHLFYSTSLALCLS